MIQYKSVGDRACAGFSIGLQQTTPQPFPPVPEHLLPHRAPLHHICSYTKGYKPAFFFFSSLYHVAVVCLLPKEIGGCACVYSAFPSLLTLQVGGSSGQGQGLVCEVTNPSTSSRGTTGQEKDLLCQFSQTFFHRVNDSQASRSELRFHFG